MTQKYILKKLYYWLPPIFWAGVIFFASSQPYEQQDLRSTLSDRFNLEIVENVFGEAGFTYAGSEISIAARGVEGFVEFFIRKGAHVAGYLILGFLVYRLLNHYFQKRLYMFFSALSIVIMYATLDEIHQYFTPNRTALVEDVILDSVGGLIGILLAQLIYHRQDGRKK